jgi:acetyl-CoA acetyltransferase
MTLKDRTCIVGMGYTPWYRRGGSWPRTVQDLAIEAILRALDDAGLSVDELDGFSFYAEGAYGPGSLDGALLGGTLGLPVLRFSASETGGGNGSCGAVGNAAAAIHAGMANVVVVVKTLQQAGRRLGRARDDGAPAGNPFFAPYGLFAPGQHFALIVRRHMHLYGTTTRHLGEVAVAERFHASRNPRAVMRQPITLEDHAQSRLISDPFHLLDYCLETDGAVAVVVASAERARDLKQRPVYVMAATQGGPGRWGRGINTMQMPDEIFATAGATTVADDLYKMAGVTPEDIDVAELYDHFSGMVILQLEDYGFAKRGEGGPFVENGGIRWPDGRLPVNTMGGQLSDGYIIGMTHIVEAVDQLRGTSTCQVENAELALVSGGPSQNPVSALILRR